MKNELDEDDDEITFRNGSEEAILTPIATRELRNNDDTNNGELNSLREQLQELRFQRSEISLEKQINKEREEILILQSESTHTSTHPTGSQLSQQLLSRVTDSGRTEGIRDGFTLIDTTNNIESVECDNYRSATQFNNNVAQQILTEIQHGNSIVSLTKPKVVSALVAIPKSNNKMRLIHDANRPPGKSLNDNVDPDTMLDTEAAYWAACLIDFFGLLRANNVLVKNTFDPSRELRTVDAF
ncbi:hypothetical protein LOTGIDRAFT_165167 [Lottia gigantea]|uniref:Uncharacterized protein n=1 Tax=Lottia gigantea TaxID=225164 RepID=V4BJ04_LOTGI|nr:hypothetical protein LOTGIDRAFT_165167 [Lottia gigantea]ESO88754.1 hypothetical protein LOTGIDRAFT_165167 [Lottia gigantea]